MKTKDEYKIETEILKIKLEDKNDIASNWKKRADKLQERVDDLTDLLKKSQLECAELHGFINRVEIEDDVSWHDRHGVDVYRQLDNGKVINEGTKPPLRQRVRGQRYITNTNTHNDIFDTLGRPSRHSG